MKSTQTRMSSFNLRGGVSVGHLVGHAATIVAFVVVGAITFGLL